MKNKLNSFSIITIFVCLSLVGLFLVPFLNIQLTSDRPSSKLDINYTWPKSSAIIIEQKITSKLEGYLNTMPNVREISSTSTKGRGNISITFKKGTDLDAARFTTASVIRTVYPSLPKDCSYPNLSSGNISDETSPILVYSINANQSSYFIHKYAKEHIINHISTIKGVAEVKVYGASGHQWKITYNSNKINKLELSVEEISKSIETYLKKEEVGIIKVPNINGKPIQEKFAYVSSFPVEGINWNHIPIKQINGRVVHLGDIANITLEDSEVDSYYRVNGKNTVNIVINPEQGRNQIELAEQIKAKVNSLKESIPEGYKITIAQDNSNYLINELNKVLIRTLYSFLILLILCFLSYKNIKHLFVLLTSILTNLLIASIFFHLFDVRLTLYSFVGITISLGIIIDNSIILIDHLKKYGNMRIFLAMFASTLTTISALLTIFFLEEHQRLNLIDFALVIAINIGTSLLVSYFFVPALMFKLKLYEKRKVFSWNLRRKWVILTKKYLNLILIWKTPSAKWGLILLLILGFGIPLNLLPESLDSKEGWGGIYNKTLGSTWFKEEVKPSLEKLTGGALNLFIENVHENSYYPEPTRTSLVIKGSLPEGGTILQLNQVNQVLESFLATFNEIELFQTEISSPRKSSIKILFKKEHELGVFPYLLKNTLENIVINLGGVEWNITGVGRGFSNELYTDYRNYAIIVQGYDYNELHKIAKSVEKKLEEVSNGNARDIIVHSGKQTVSTEYFLTLDNQILARTGIASSKVFRKIKNSLLSESLRPVVLNGELQKVKIYSDNHKKWQVWDLENTPIMLGNTNYKLKTIGSVEKRKSSDDIIKKNQQYLLNVAYNFKGSKKLVEEHQKKLIKEFSGKIPLGYSLHIPEQTDKWDRSDVGQYIYLFAIIVLIFFICSILLESLIQPLGILIMIPVSFIGVFLTFYLFELNFDQGGYASLVLLSGISINSAIYLINDFNNLKKNAPHKDSMILYCKAFNRKIGPILLTIGSTIAGLIPFIMNGQNQIFWFSFAAGSVGGLLFSLLGIFVYLPIFVSKRS